MNPFVAEFIGTTLLVLFGNGVVANVVLSRTKGNNGGWIVIAAGWAFAVFIRVFFFPKVSGAHLKSAVTLPIAAPGTICRAPGARFCNAQVRCRVRGAPP